MSEVVATPGGLDVAGPEGSPRRRVPLRGRAAAAAAVLDQGVASCGNIALLVLVARDASIAEFATFSFAYIIFTVVLGLTGAFVGQPLVLVRETGTDPRLATDVRSAAAGALVVTTAVALLLGVPTVVIGLAIGTPSAVAFAALGAVLPVLLSQEIARYVFAALRQPHLALLSDTVKLVLLVSAFLVVPTQGAAEAVLVWGCASIPALALSLGLLWRQLARPRQPFRSVVAPGYLGRRFIVEFAVGNGSSQLGVLGIGVFGAPAAVGALRGASTIFGPLNVLFSATTSFGPPYVGRMSDTRRKVRAAGRIAVGLALVALVWGLLAYLAPVGVGQEILGETWVVAHALVPATAAQFVAMSFGSAGILALRVVEPRSTLPIQVVFSTVSLAAMVLGFVGWGVIGAAWGLAAGSTLKALALWHRAFALRRAQSSVPARI